MQRALQQAEKSTLRLRQRDAGTGPKDDLDLEWEALAAAYRAAHGWVRGPPPPGPACLRPLPGLPACA